MYLPADKTREGTSRSFHLPFLSYLTPSSYRQGKAGDRQSACCCFCAMYRLALASTGRDLAPTSAWYAVCARTQPVRCVGWPHQTWHGLAWARAEREVRGRRDVCVCRTQAETTKSAVAARSGNGRATARATAARHWQVAAVPVPPHLPSLPCLACYLTYCQVRRHLPLFFPSRLSCLSICT